MSEATEDDLLFKIGKELCQGRADRSFLQRQDIIRYAKDWLEANQRQLQHVVCSNPIALRYMRGQLTSEEEVLKAIADAIGGVFTYLPCASIAQYVLSKGLTAYCRIT